jgi:hypothetical protein
MPRLLLTVSFALLVSVASAQSNGAAPAEKGVAAAAKSQIDNGRTTAIAPGTVLHGDCPVAMSARQVGLGNIVAAKASQPVPSGPAQHLHLSLSSRKGNTIVAAQITVHGLNGKPMMLEVESSAANSVDASRRMSVSFDDATPSESGADLIAPNFTAVRFIELDSLTYADGSIWKSNSGACRVEPDSLMLVSAR